MQKFDTCLNGKENNNLFTVEEKGGAVIKCLDLDTKQGCSWLVHGWETTKKSKAAMQRLTIAKYLHSSLIISKSATV